MMDRDSLPELFKIVTVEAAHRHLAMTALALPYVSTHFGQGCDVYFRRRLSVCRMLIDLHLPVSLDMLDVLLAVTLCHSLPGDLVPPGYRQVIQTIFSQDPRVDEIFTTLSGAVLAGDYDRLKKDPYALIIRLTERGVLVQSLYEWENDDARRYIRETREHFYSMCIYAKEQYPELMAPVTILMEKTRNLVAANEVMIGKYEQTEDALTSEILSLREENAAMRALLAEIEGIQEYN